MTITMVPTSVGLAAALDQHDMVLPPPLIEWHLKGDNT